jgi:hypothetical protein
MVEAYLHRVLVNSDSQSLTGLIFILEPPLPVRLGPTDAPPWRLAAACSSTQTSGLVDEQDRFMKQFFETATAPPPCILN